MRRSGLVGEAPEGTIVIPWFTGRTTHFDRAASAWLIWRFVDPQLELSFIESCAAAR